MKGIPENPYSDGGRYTKLKEGTLRLRFFNYIDGWEYWIDADGNPVERGKRAGEGGKPVRVKTEDLDSLDLEARKNAQYFRAYRVYNYESQNTEILQLKQRTILEPLISYLYDEDWGNGKGLDTFDIAITRTGEGLETVYQVTPKPKKEFEGKLKEINLEALYDGGDPFTATIAEGSDEDKFDLDDLVEQVNG